MTSVMRVGTLGWVIAGGLLVSAMSGCLRQPGRAGVSGKAPVTGSGKPVSHFPTRREFEARAGSATPPAATTLPPVVSVEQWNIETPAPEAGAPYGQDTLWDRVLVEATAGKRSRPSSALRCAAQESARVCVNAGGYPDDQLRRYLVARCGGTQAMVDLGTLYALVPNQVPEARVETEFRAGVRQLIEQVGATKDEIGLGYGRGNGQVCFAVYGSTRTASLDPVSPRFEGERIELSGTLPSDTAYALGLVTRGEFGVRRCEPDRSVVAPRFKVVCPIAQQDELAMVEIGGRRSRDMLWNVALRWLVRKSDAVGLLYQPRAAQGADSADFALTLQGTINDIRRRVGRRALLLEPTQSQTNRELAAYLEGAVRAGNWSLLELGSLTMLAGWDVRAMIRNAGIYWATLGHVSSARRWLDYTLESPFGRWVLLDPDMSRLAVGAARVGESGTVAVVTTYAVFDSPDHSADEDAVFKELTELRKARGLAEPRRLPRGQLLTEALVSVAQHKQSVDNAVPQLVQEVSQRSGDSISGWAVETNSLYHFAPPDPLFQPSLSLELGITHYQPPGAAWGQYVMVFLVHDTAKLPTARAGGLSQPGRFTLTQS